MDEGTLSSRVSPIGTLRTHFVYSFSLSSTTARVTMPTMGQKEVTPQRSPLATCNLPTISKEAQPATTVFHRMWQSGLANAWDCKTFSYYKLRGQLCDNRVDWARYACTAFESPVISMGKLLYVARASGEASRMLFWGSTRSTIESDDVASTLRSPRRKTKSSPMITIFHAHLLMNMNNVDHAQLY